MITKPQLDRLGRHTFNKVFSKLYLNCFSENVRNWNLSCIFCPRFNRSGQSDTRFVVLFSGSLQCQVIAIGESTRVRETYPLSRIVAVQRAVLGYGLQDSVVFFETQSVLRQLLETQTTWSNKELLHCKRLLDTLNAFTILNGGKRLCSSSRFKVIMTIYTNFIQK